LAFLGRNFQSCVRVGLSQNKLTVHVLAAVAEHEREAISARTKAALAAAKARGTKLGNPNGAMALRGYSNTAAVSAVKAGADRHAAQVLPVVEAIRDDGIGTLAGIARALNERGVLTARGGTWDATRVRNLLLRSPEP
jgi:DNA invertase Pin-like site-specific DNA recombinase